jgi:lipoprotein-anchoring transpeptidase ErfK/SrfK
MALALAALIALPPAAFAQVPAAKAPAKPVAVDVSQQKVELLFVQNATSIQYDKAKGTLRMKNIARSTLFFTDRPVRMAGHYHTRDEFLPAWSEGPDSFAKNPPNATLSLLEVGKADLQNVVINLKNPRMQGKDLIYDITIIEGTVPPSAGDAVLFIDILGFWRRNIRRVAVIGTAAAVTTAAVATSSAEASAAAARAAAPPPPPPTVNVQVTAPPAAPQSAATQKLEQLKSLLSEGLITQAQYQKASTQVLNEMVK